MECVSLFDEVIKAEASSGRLPAVAASRNLSFNEEKNFDSFSRSVKLTDVMRRFSADFWFAFELRFSG